MVFELLGRWIPPELRTRASVRTLRVLAWRVAGAALAFASTVLVTRLFGPESAGRYFLAVALASIAITVARLGFDLPTMRLVSIAGGSADKHAQRSVLEVAARLSGLVALGLTLGLIIGSGYLASAFDEPALGPLIRLTGIGVLPAALGVLYARGLMGVGRPEIAEFGQRAGFQIVFVLFVCLTFSRLGELSLGVAFTAAYFTMLAVLVGAWIHATRRPRSKDANRALRSELMRAGLPLLIAATINLVTAWSDTLMLGYLVNSHDVGVYGAAQRVATVVSFVLVATGSIAGPKFASHFTRSDRQALEQVFRRAAKGSSIAALVIAAPLFLMAPHILRVFGQDFAQGATALRILVAAQVVNSIAGLVGLVLAMSKREKRVLRSSLVAATVNIVLNILLIPRLGIVGAAVSTMVALVLFNSLNTLWVYRDLGLSVIGGRERPNPRGSF